jgi:hypothetical protein
MLEDSNQIQHIITGMCETVQIEFDRGHLYQVLDIFWHNTTHISQVAEAIHVMLY